MGARVRQRCRALGNPGSGLHAAPDRSLPAVLPRGRGIPCAGLRFRARSAQPLDRALSHRPGDPGGPLRTDRDIRPDHSAARRGLGHRARARRDAGPPLRRIRGVAALRHPPELVLRDADVGVPLGHARRPGRVGPSHCPPLVGTPAFGRPASSLTTRTVLGGARTLGGGASVGGSAPASCDTGPDPAAHGPATDGPATDGLADLAGPSRAVEQARPLGPRRGVG